MVGDSSVDVITGRNAGLWTCGVTYGFAPHTLCEAPPDVTVDHPENSRSIQLRPPPGRFFSPSNPNCHIARTTLEHSSQSCPWRNPMKTVPFGPMLCLAIASITPTAFAQQPAGLGPNQTQGFGASRSSLRSLTPKASTASTNRKTTSISTRKKRSRIPQNSKFLSARRESIPPSIHPEKSEKLRRRQPQIFVLVPDVLSRQRPESQRRDLLQGSSRRHNLRSSIGQSVDRFLWRDSRSLQGKPKSVYPVPRSRKEARHLHHARVES